MAATSALAAGAAGGRTVFAKAKAIKVAVRAITPPPAIAAGAALYAFVAVLSLKIDHRKLVDGQRPDLDLRCVGRCTDLQRCRTTRTRRARRAGAIRRGRWRRSRDGGGLSWHRRWVHHRNVFIRERDIRVHRNRVRDDHEVMHARLDHDSRVGLEIDGVRYPKSSIYGDRCLGFLVIGTSHTLPRRNEQLAYDFHGRT